MKIRTCLLVFSIFIFNAAVFAQVGDERRDVKAVIDKLFDGMKNRDQELMESVFHKSAVLHTIKTDAGNSQLLEYSVAEMLNRIATSPVETVLEEKLDSMEIWIDGDLASVWTPYKFFVNGNFSHCGVNSFQLVKSNGAWKVSYIIDTRRKEGCMP